MSTVYGELVGITDEDRCWSATEPDHGSNGITARRDHATPSLSQSGGVARDGSGAVPMSDDRLPSPRRATGSKWRSETVAETGGIEPAVGGSREA